MPKDLLAFVGSGLFIVDCEPVNIGDNVWIGANSVIHSGVSSRERFRNKS